jgi:hypothetical protein
MTDRIKGLTVALSRDIRDDDVEEIVNAIIMIKGVSGVTKSKVDMSDYTARVRVLHRIQDKVLDVFREESGLKLD